MRNDIHVTHFSQQHAQARTAAHRPQVQASLERMHTLLLTKHALHNSQAKLSKEVETKMERLAHPGIDTPKSHPDKNLVTASRKPHQHDAAHVTADGRH